MAEQTETEKRKFVTFTGDIAVAIEKEAAAERRSFANMAEVLILEALARRQDTGSQ